MAKFRKKPVIIEAIQFLETKENFDSIKEFMGKDSSLLIYDYQELPRVFIKTLEGRMGVSKGDWVIRGIKNEFYPIKPDIFKATYEPVED